MSINDILNDLKAFGEDLNDHKDGWGLFDFVKLYEYIKDKDRKPLKTHLIKNNYFGIEELKQKKELINFIGIISDKNHCMIEEKRSKALDRIYNQLIECVNNLSNESFPSGYLKLSEKDLNEIKKILKKLMNSSDTLEVKKNKNSLRDELRTINNSLHEKLGYTDFDIYINRLFKEVLSNYIIDESAIITFDYADSKNAPLDVKSTIDCIKDLNTYKFDIENYNPHIAYDRTLAFFEKHNLLNKAEIENYNDILKKIQETEAEIIIGNLKSHFCKTKLEGQEQKRNYFNLTPRERQVIDLVATGMDSTNIALKLSIKKSTVDTHIKHCIASLNVSGKGEAVAKVCGLFTQN